MWPALKRYRNRAPLAAFVLQGIGFNLPLFTENPTHKTGRVMDQERAGSLFL